MNTLAKLYKQSLFLFNIAPASKQTQLALINLVTSFVANPKPVAVDIIQPTKVKESSKALWQSLEEYDLCIRFISRKDKHAVVILQYLEPKPCPFSTSKVKVYKISREKLAA